MTNAGKISSDDGLQFGTVETADENVPAGVSASTTCVACRQPINSTYYAVADKVVCPSCAAQLDQPPRGSKMGRFALATAFGFAAGLVGAIVWFAIRRFANMEIGIVAIVVGFMVGTSVRKGSGGVGGRGFQVLAVLITYCCIALNYMPDVVEAMIQLRNEDKIATLATVQHEDNASMDVANNVALYVDAFMYCLTLPFLDGAANIIGLLIIGFALWEAWKLNAYRKLPITGPYELGKAPAVS